MLNYSVGLVAMTTLASAIDIPAEKQQAFQEKMDAVKENPNATGFTQDNC